MSYCVYVHRRKDTNKVFYVGMGNSKRPYKKSFNKTHRWLIINNIASGHTVQIIDSGLTKNIASELELLVIEMSSFIVNIHKTCILTKRIPDNISEYVYYDETSPTGLRWKKTTSNKSIKDQIAGSFNRNRVEIMIDGGRYFGHRVVMKLHGKDNIDLTVNHKDCNSSNNDINNLELITQRENNNKKYTHVYDKPISRNTSGKSKISETFRLNRSGRITYYSICQWVDSNGKSKSKTFSYLRYGILEAFQKACEFRDNSITK